MRLFWLYYKGSCDYFGIYRLSELMWLWGYIRGIYIAILFESDDHCCECFFFCPECASKNIALVLSSLIIIQLLAQKLRRPFIVRRAGLLWSQQDFEWRWSVPLFKCLAVLEFSFILFDLCLLITFFNFIMNYVPIVTFWIFTYHKIWILSIMFCSIWSYWIIYFLACLEVSWRVVS